MKKHIIALSISLAAISGVAQAQQFPSQLNINMQPQLSLPVQQVNQNNQNIRQGQSQYHRQDGYHRNENSFGDRDGDQGGEGRHHRGEGHRGGDNQGFNRGSNQGFNPNGGNQRQDKNQGYKPNSGSSNQGFNPGAGRGSQNQGQNVRSNFN